MKTCSIDNCSAEPLRRDTLCPSHRERRTVLGRTLLDMHISRATYRYPFRSIEAPTLPAPGALSVLSVIVGILAALIIVGALALLASPDPSHAERPAHYQGVKP
jgi:hypothetical protein